MRIYFVFFQCKRRKIIGNEKFLFPINPLYFCAATRIYWPLNFLFRLYRWSKSATIWSIWKNKSRADDPKKARGKDRASLRIVLVYKQFTENSCFCPKAQSSSCFVPLLQHPSPTIRCVNSPHVPMSNTLSLLSTTSSNPLHAGHSVLVHTKGTRVVDAANSSYITVLTHAWKGWMMRTMRNRTNELV